MHILHIQRENTCTSISQFIDTIAWFPIPGPSYLRTTTYIHHHCSLICRMMLRESLLILVAWQRVLSRLHPPGLEEGVPEWRILESHTRLVLAHGARRSLQIDTVQPTLWFTNNSEYAKYAKYAQYDLVSEGQCTLPAQKHRHTHGTACLCLSLYEF